MNPALWAALGGASALLLVLLGAGLALLLVRTRRAEADDARVAAARAEVEALRGQVEELSSQVRPAQTEESATADDGAVLPAEYVITTAGGDADPETAQVPSRAVLSVTLGEPLVRVAAFGYGLRRALSAESRNRIAFEIRREVKRSRKARRRVARRTRVADTQRGEAA